MGIPDYYAIGQRIRKYRRACGMSQDELSEKVDISVNGNMVTVNFDK